MSDLNNIFDVGARALSAQMVRLNTTATAGQLGSSPLIPVIWMCEATPRMRVRNSF